MMMNEQDHIDYERIRSAIAYIRGHFREQPSLEAIADHVSLSPFHFQRLFTEWAGVSPKKFLQYTSVTYAKQVLKEGAVSLADAAFASGLSGTGRLHDLFVTIEGMTPGEYKNGGEALAINYCFAESPFGEILVASTPRGVCYMGFADDRDAAFGEILSRFPRATYSNTVDIVQQNALQIFRRDWNALDQVKLHLKASEFQLKVWEALLKIPFGALSTYQRVAAAIRNPGASRAVGTAIGSNPVAFLIPCHRVIGSGGETGGYMWDPARKASIIGWEASRLRGDGATA